MAGDHEQLELLPAPAVARAAAAPLKVPRPIGIAERLPVARVLVDLPLAHLDRPFDYLVPEKFDAAVVPGSRVKVRFAGQDVDGFVLERVEASDHAGRLMPLRRAVSAEPVLAPEIAELSALVAARYAGTRSDVLRLAIPPRHATTEKQASRSAPSSQPDLDAAQAAWSPYDVGLVPALAQGRSPRRVWTANAGADWPLLLAHAAAATLASGRGSVLCVPDQRDLDRLDVALAQVLGKGSHVVLAAELGPAARYRSFLAVARGAVKVVAGTRNAAYAPVHDLGLAAIWDDGDDLHAEPRAPYAHAREVLLLRGHHEEAAVLIGGFAQSAEAAGLLQSGWAQALAAPRAVVRAAAPTVHVSGDSDLDLARDPLARATRLPHEAMEVVRRGLAHGAVLVQTPRGGYLRSLVCDSCRTPATCAECGGPLGLPGKLAHPTCRWCGREETAWSCRDCGGRGLRAPVIGEGRTAEELGRAFPGVPVVRSAGAEVRAQAPDTAALVVATPGGEPWATGGYAAALLLDTWLPLARPDLRAHEEAVRRWFNAAALVRSDGEVFVVGEPSSPAIQALVRWDPAGFAARELEQRLVAHFPPASRLATLTGAEADVASFLAALTLPPGGEVLGPVPVEAEEQVRAVVRVPKAYGAALSRALVEEQGVRSARKLPNVRVQVDPVALA